MTPFPDTAPDVSTLSREARRLYDKALYSRCEPGQEGEDELVAARLGYVQSPGQQYANFAVLQYAPEFARLDLPRGKSGYACRVSVREQDSHRERLVLAATGGVFGQSVEGRGYHGRSVPRMRFEARSNKRDCDGDRVYIVRFEIEYPTIVQVAREATIVEGILREPAWYIGTTEPAESGPSRYSFVPPEHRRLDGVHCQVILTDTLHEIGSAE